MSIFFSGCGGSWIAKFILVRVSVGGKGLRGGTILRVSFCD